MELMRVVAEAPLCITARISVQYEDHEIYRNGNHEKCVYKF